MDTKEFNRLIKSLEIDKNLLDDIYLFYQPKIFLHIKIMFGKYGDEFARDVTQDFFFYLYKNRKNLPNIKYPVSWIFTVCDNIARKKLDKGYHNVEFNDANENIVYLDNEELFIESYIKTENIRFAIQQLSLIEQKILFEKIWLGYTLKEVAVRTDQNYEAIKKKYRRSLKKLKILLTDVPFSAIKEPVIIE